MGHNMHLATFLKSDLTYFLWWINDKLVVEFSSKFHISTLFMNRDICDDKDTGYIALTRKLIAYLHIVYMKKIVYFINRQDFDCANTILQINRSSILVILFSLKHIIIS